MISSLTPACLIASRMMVDAPYVDQVLRMAMREGIEVVVRNTARSVALAQRHPSLAAGSNAVGGVPTPPVLS
jgi:hypothetical protein